MKKYLSKIKIIIIALVLTIGINWVSAAYIPKPSCTPPSCDAPSFINSGESAQFRMGGLTIGPSGSAGEGLVYVNGSLSADGMVVSNMYVATGDILTNHLYFTSDAFSSGYVSNELCIMTTTKQVVKCN